MTIFKKIDAIELRSNPSSKLQCIAYQLNAVNLGGGGTVGS